MSDITLQYTDAGFLKFNDSTHVNKFLEYLFRIDKNQRWTNAMTDSNLFVYAQDGKFEVFPFSDIVTTRTTMVKLSKLILEMSGLGYNDVTRGLIYFDLLDDNGAVLNVASVTDLSYLVNLVNLYDSHEFYFGVVHLDQGQPHMHMVLEK